MTAGIENFVQTVTLQPLAIDGMSLELALQGDTSAFNLPIDCCSYLLLMERESVAGGGCRPKFVEIIKYDGYEDDGVTLKITERGVGDTEARAWPIGAVVQQPFLKEHFACVLQQLCGIEALLIDQVKDSLIQYVELLRQNKRFADFLVAYQSGQSVQGRKILANAGDIKELSNTVASQGNALAQHKAQLSSVAMALAYQSEAKAMYLRSIGQSGLLRVRQYNYHGDFKRPATESGQPAHMHNHPQYRYLLGSGEVQFVINGYLGQTRHRDYSMVTPQAVGSNYTAVDYIQPPALPESLTTGSVEDQTTALRELFQRFQEGEMPEGFGWTLTALECWFEPFSEEVTDAYSGTFRHAQYVENMNQALREGIQWTAGGARHLGENYAFEMPVCRILDTEGNPVVGILKHRMIAVDVSSLGDLRPYIHRVDDPVRCTGMGVESTRFLIEENDYAGGMLDRMMGLLPGLDGHGAVLREEYPSSGYTVYDYFEQGQELNAAYYSRFTHTKGRDASNQSVLLRGFNDPYLFAASTSREEVLNTPINGLDYRFSWAIPMEVVLRTPLETWNPYEIPEASYGSLSAGSAGDGSQVDPLHGYNSSAYYYITPTQLFSGGGFADVADTVGSGVWMRGGDGEAYKCRESGHWVTLPTIDGVEGSIRQRYSIFPDHQDGSKAMQLARAGYLAYELSLIEGLNDDLKMEKRLFDQGQVIESLQ